MDFSKLKVLLVDDESVIRATLKFPLGDLGIQDFLEAENGLAALEILKGEEVGLIISDLVMNKMNGLELLNELKKSEDWKDIPFIFLTGTTIDREALSDANDIISKPIDDVEDFKARVKEVLEKKGGLNKEFLLQVLDRALMVSYHTTLYKPLDQAIFIGKAAEWEKFFEDKFQVFMEDNKIYPATEIIIWEKEDQEDAYAVTKKSEIT